MNKGISVKLVVINAMIAGVYAVLTLAISPIAYSEIQFRLSEIIVFLAFYNRRYIPGLTIGCIIANLFSPMGMLDIVFAGAGAIITGMIIGAELWYAFNIPYVINAIYVAVGELIVLIIGALVFKSLEKNDRLMNLLDLK